MLKYFKVKEYKAACWINPRKFGDYEQSFVFIHGSGGNSGSWSFQYGKLHKLFNVAAVDLPGHGKSGGHGEQDISAYVERLRDIIDALKLERPILVGHSLGAAIALCFAARYPQNLSGVASVGGGLTMPVNPGILEGFRQQPEITLDLMCKFSLARENRPGLYDALRASLGQSDIEVVAGDMLACSKFDLTDEVGKITVPVLVLCGTEDKMTPPVSSEQIARGIPDAKLFLIHGAGHMVMMEKPEAFNDALNNFARSLPRTVTAK